MAYICAARAAWRSASKFSRYQSVGRRRMLARRPRSSPERMAEMRAVCACCLAARSMRDPAHRHWLACPTRPTFAERCDGGWELTADDPEIKQVLT
eukprot:scaffold7183_cov60-Phaeocystis_antarctica.AAC.8